jgi:hypothetical protein
MEALRTLRKEKEQPRGPAKVLSLGFPPAPRKPRPLPQEIVPLPIVKRLIPGMGASKGDCKSPLADALRAEGRPFLEVWFRPGEENAAYTTIQLVFAKGEPPVTQPDYALAKAAIPGLELGFVFGPPAWMMAWTVPTRRLRALSYQLAEFRIKRLKRIACELNKAAKAARHGQP